MKRAVIGFERDEEGHWVARLACGHGSMRDMILRGRCGSGWHGGGAGGSGGHGDGLQAM
jgi:hypothetical protein